MLFSYTRCSRLCQVTWQKSWVNSFFYLRNMSCPMHRRKKMGWKFSFPSLLFTFCHACVTFPHIFFPNLRKRQKKKNFLLFFSSVRNFNGTLWVKKNIRNLLLLFTGFRSRQVMEYDELFLLFLLRPRSSPKWKNYGVRMQHPKKGTLLYDRNFFLLVLLVFLLVKVTIA